MLVVMQINFACGFACDSLRTTNALLSMSPTETMTNGVFGVLDSLAYSVSICSNCSISDNAGADLFGASTVRIV